MHNKDHWSWLHVTATRWAAHNLYPRKRSSSSFQLIFLGAVELMFVHLASFRPWFPTGWEDRSDESRTHRRLRCNEKTWPDLLRSVAGTLDNTMDTKGTLNWCQQFRPLPCANLLHAHAILHDLMDGGFCNVQSVSYATDRDLLITHYNPFYGFNVFVGSDGWWTAHSGCLFGDTFWIPKFSHPLGDSAVPWSRVLVNIIQLLANIGSVQPFPGEKLYDCSMLNIQHFSKTKIHGWQNAIFSYQGNESIGPKLVYLNKNTSSIEWQKPNASEMGFEISCTNFPDNLILHLIKSSRIKIHL